MIALPWGVILVSIFGLIFFFLFTGMPVAVALGLVGTLSAFLFLNRMGIVGYAAWQMCNSFILSAVPLFVFMGHLLLAGGLSTRLYEGSSAILGRVRGGLLHANIAACAIFAAVTGSSVATSATIGTMALPEMEKRGYDTKLSLGSIAAGGTLGILIPPSTCLIIYGVIVEESIGELFIAGILPGFMLAALFMLYIWTRVKIKPDLAPASEPLGFVDVAKRLLRMWPIFVIIVVILGGIYGGIMTPTEAAAVGACIALVNAIVSRKMSFATLQKVLLDTVKTTTQLLFIMIGASLIAGTLGLLRVPELMADWIISLGIPAVVVMMFIYLMYMILGCFIDTVSMIVMTLPVIFPLIVSLGYDPIWFGIIITILVEMAMITPPVGLNVYVIHGLRPKQPIANVFLGSLPFFLIMLLSIAILTAFPVIATWLPSTMVMK